MNVLSLFDGISAGQVALERAEIKVDNYYASEIDKYAIQVTMKNYPNTIQLGSVTNWKEWDIDFSNIDLVIGGSPCQGFSFAGKQLNFEDERSKLFFEFSDILKHIKSLNSNVKFLLENVRMKQEYQDVISEHLEVKPIIINSSLVSAQNRLRYYWTNIENVEQPIDKGILVKDIIYDDTYSIFTDIRILNTKKKTKNYVKWDLSGKQYWSQQDRAYYKEGKICTLPKANPSNKLNILIDYEKDIYRRLHPVEAERCQTLPDNYTYIISKNKRLEALGNSWTVDVVAHIFKNIQ
jgi:site-specific DNA-cytosine methylase